MRSFMKLVLAAFLAAVFQGAALASTSLTVHIQLENGTPVRDVSVAALEFGMNGPSTHTQVGVTNAAGNAVFTLPDQKSFNIMFSSHGYSPTIYDQFNNPEYNPDKYIWTDGQARTSTFTVVHDQVEVGRIIQEFLNATPNKVLMGGLYNMQAQMPGPSAISISSNDGTGFLVIDNVPYADADTYNVGLYDPEKNRGIGRNVMQALSAATPPLNGAPTISYTGTAKLNFNQSVPPTRVETNNQPGGDGASADVSVQGVVQQLGYSTSTARYMGIGVRACIDGLPWNTWTNVDENGGFKLSGLTPGNTYFVSLMGGCSWGGPDSESVCFEPYTSAQYDTRDICTADHSSINSNDIIYRNSDVMYHTIELRRMPPSIGQVGVYVRSSSGYTIPNANVNINPDGTPWPNSPTSCQTPNNYAAFDNKPGFSNANVNTSAAGYALLDGLPSGNYMINVWTPFSSGGNGPSSVNQGPDGTFTAWGMNGGGGNWQEAHCNGTGVDDYRISITTWTTPTFHLYNSSGTLMRYDAGGNIVAAPAGIVDVTSITYIVSAQGANTGLVRGTLSFPVEADLMANPIMITLYPQCGGNGPCGSGNFTVVSSSGARQYSYQVPVSSGASYYMNVNAQGWGRINRGGGNNMINLVSTGTAVVDISFAQAGAVTGTLYKPDGTVFTPSSNQYIWIDANNSNGWTGTQLQKDGTFAMYDVLPGLNRFTLYLDGGPSNSTVNYAMPTPAPELEVVAGSTATLNINLLNAKYVGIAADLTRAPDRTIIASGWSQTLGFKVIPLPAGSVFNGETIMGMLKGGDNEGYEFRYSTGTRMNEEGPCGQGWRGGFCATAMPAPSVYDFYLMRQGDFGDMSQQQVNAAENPYPHFVVLSSSKNVAVDSAHANSTVYSSGNSSTHTASGVLVDLTPATDMSSRGNATLRGHVTASNFFRRENYESCGGDMDKFMQYLPVVSLYETNGAFRAAGIVVPPPDFIALKDQTREFESSFSLGFTQFTALLAQAPYFGYEIRALAPSTCYTAVLTTPNYPPYQSRVCTGAAGSTTTLTMDLDSVVGAGATLQGVVRTTDSVVLANASVQLISEGMDPKSGVTNASGAYSFPGLPPGTMRIKVSAEGYASMEDELDLTGSNVYTQNYSLTAAAGVITGTVYSQKLPYSKVQAGAQIVAYDDTYNGQNPNAPLPLIKTKTGADGTYRLTGLVPGHIYKVFLKVTGKYTLNQATAAVAGVQPNIDFTMLPKPLDIEIFAKKGEEYYEFTVLNPQDFKTGWAGWSVSPFNGVSASTVTLSKVSSGELVGKIPLSALAAGQVYVLRGIAQSYSGKTVTRDLLFGKSYKGNADQQIDDAILGDDSDDGTGRKLNEVAMDKTGDDPSGIMFPPGAVLPVSTAAIPTCAFKGEDKDDASVAGKVAALGADAFAGNLYTLSLSSITANANKSIELTLAYDKSTANLNDLSVARYNDATGKWENFSGVATVNPVKGTVKVKLKSLASVLNTRRGSGLQVNSFDGKQYNVRPSAAGSSTSGTFAVVRPSIAGNGFTGSKLKVFNYPNPFNLKDKAISNNQGAALPGNTAGTVIHVEVPAGNGGAGHIRIYTLAGELVNDLVTTFTAGAHNYVLWNGKNKGGQPVANGVYYGVVELSGKSPDLKDATFKMAVIK